MALDHIEEFVRIRMAVLHMAGPRRKEGSEHGAVLRSLPLPGDDKTNIDLSPAALY